MSNRWQQIEQLFHSALEREGNHRAAVDWLEKTAMKSQREEVGAVL
jgi:hypothetical protein